MPDFRMYFHADRFHPQDESAQRATVDWAKHSNIGLLRNDLSEEQATDLENASSRMHPYDISRLWLHRAHPFAAGQLISAINDDGWAATEYPNEIWHVTGLDCQRPWLNQYVALDLDELLGRVLASRQTHQLLSASRDYETTQTEQERLLDQRSTSPKSWRDRSAAETPKVGAFTGWVIRTAPKLVVAPLGSNSAEFAPDAGLINQVLGRIGQSRLDWGVAHDLIVSEQSEPQLPAPLREFVGLLIHDLMLAGANQLAELEESPSGRVVSAIPVDASTAQIEFVLHGWSLYGVNAALKPIKQSITEPFDFHVSEGSWASSHGECERGTIVVEALALVCPESEQTACRIAAALNSIGTWWESGTDATFTRQITADGLSTVK